LVDAVGVTESDKTDSRPLERAPSVPLEKLLRRVAEGDRSVDTLASLAGRLARLDRKLSPAQAAQIPKVSAADGHGPDLKAIANRLLDALDPDKIADRARGQGGLLAGVEPSEAQFQAAQKAMADEAALPFSRAPLREKILQLTKDTDQTLDHVSKDTLLSAGFDAEKAQGLIQNFRAFMDQKQDELLALEILYKGRWKERHLTYQAIKDLAEAMAEPPFHIAPDMVWKAYARLDAGRVKGADSQRLLTDLISLVRFTVGACPELEPFPEEVERRFQGWLQRRQAGAHPFTAAQVEWLTLFKERIASASSMEIDDLDQTPFAQKGGPSKAVELFGRDLRGLLEELNEALVA